MAWSIIEKASLQTLLKFWFNPVNACHRYGHHLRGKPPGKARSLDERLHELNAVDPELCHRVDISLPPEDVQKQHLEERIKVLKENRMKRDMSKLDVTPIDLTKSKELWLKTTGPAHIRDIADHYGIFECLYDRAYFYPHVPLKVTFSSEHSEHPVYFGNTIKPKAAKNAPSVHYTSDSGTLWTLTLTNLDGHFSEPEKEYIHWMVVNIPGSNIAKGDTIFEYMQPFPPKGTGFHRYVFVLYKQDKKLDKLPLNTSTSYNDLTSRTFSSNNFYKLCEDLMTPGGLAFFQSDWDSTLHDFYHKVLNMKEPIFEYDFNPPYIKKEKWYPKREPFNLYMDKYRDPKQINKEFLMKKLKDVHPFKLDPSPLPYPNAQYFEGYVPTWLKLEKRKTRLKWGRINEIE